MKGKTQRLLEIKNIITEEKISSQDDLLSVLKSRGFNLTQATLSRDLKFLKISRVIDEEKAYIYSLPGSNNAESKAQSIPVSGFVSLVFSNNLAVIKTKPGFASSIAAAIDNANLFEIIGSIAGDDTIMLILREDVTHGDAKKALVMIIPEIEETN